MDNAFSLEAFIDIQTFPFPEVFKEASIWGPIKNLEAFIKAFFEKGVIKPNYKDSKNIYLGEGTRVDDNALIVGPAIIGRNCVIGHASLIRENCLFGDNVLIGHAVEVKNSIFLNNSTAAHLNYIGDSIIGNNVNISGGVIIANLRLDKKPIRIMLGEKMTDTGLLKFGALVGDNSNIGVNSVLNPGTILGKKTVVYPLCSVGGTHKEGEIIKGAA
jgi:NDP-sugar pyrophosphorylase family protein